MLATSVQLRIRRSFSILFIKPSASPDSTRGKLSVRLPRPREGRGDRSPPILAPLDTSSLIPTAPDADRSGPGITPAPSDTSMTFNDFRLAEPILRVIAAEGYETPTPIQAGVIPLALAGRDILGTAQTGTGKTAAFALPIIHRLSQGLKNGNKGHGDKGPPRGRGRAARALVLCPTRELAAQILESFATYGKGLPLYQTSIYGGVGQGRQVSAIRNGLDIIVATPGRLMDLMGQGHLNLSRIETLVLDEADRMLDMGFIHPIRQISAEIPRERQTMMLSATISKEIRVLANDLLTNPEVVATAPECTTAELVDQRLYLVEKNNKAPLLIRLFERGDMARTLVFTRTKHGADRLVRVLRNADIKAEAIHGDKSQSQRTRAMNAFRSGKAEALVATDVAARGIDVDGVTHVVNFDMPVEPESYVHRIGRTARAGASGKAVSLCDRHEIELLRGIERRTDAKPILGLDNEDLTYSMPSDGGRSASRANREAKSAAMRARSNQRNSSRNAPANRRGQPKNGPNQSVFQDHSDQDSRSDSSSGKSFKSGGKKNGKPASKSAPQSGGKNAVHGQKFDAKSGPKKRGKSNGPNSGPKAGGRSGPSAKKSSHRKGPSSSGSRSRPAS